MASCLAHMAQVRDSIRAPVIRLHMEYELLPVWVIIFCAVMAGFMQFPGTLPSPFQEKPNVHLIESRALRKRSRKSRKSRSLKRLTILETIPEESEISQSVVLESDSTILNDACSILPSEANHFVGDAILNLNSAYYNLKSIIESTQDYTQDFLEIYFSSVIKSGSLKDFHAIERERGYLLVKSMQHRKKEITKFLIKHSSQPCLQKCLTFTYKSTYLFSLLLDKVANVNFTTSNGNLLVDFLLAKRESNALFTLLSHPSFDPETVPTLLPVMIKTNVPIELFELACQTFTNHTISRVEGLNIIHLAIVFNRIDYLRIILSNLPQIDINEPINLFQSAPIHMAIANGNPDILKLILGVEGIDLHAENVIYETPLEEAEAKLSNETNYLNEKVSQEDRLACLKLLKEAYESKK